MRTMLVLLAVLLVLSGCGEPTADLSDLDVPSITVTSDALVDGGEVPVRFTCDGEDVPPPLSWSDLPEDAVEVAVVIDDPDAPDGVFTHWTVWGLPPEEGGVGEELPGGAVEGTNDFDEVGYRGPCPPPDDPPHTYRFRVLALAEPLDLTPEASADDVRAALEEHAVGQGVLSARYAR